MSSMFIKVNVGGVHFSLREDIVSQSAYFRGMLNLASSTSPTSLEVEDSHKIDFSSILIDRDQFHFAYILNCIRDPAYVDVEKLGSIKPELEYFQFTKLLSLVSSNEEEEEDEEKDDFEIEVIPEKFGECGKIEEYSEYEYGIYYLNIDSYEYFGGGEIETYVNVTVPKNYIALLKSNNRSLILMDTYISSGFYGNLKISMSLAESNSAVVGLVIKKKPLINLHFVKLK